MPEVSIIVPVYNAEKYLEQCITSLLGQTLEKIEIILVNDGSTDHSEAICKKFVNMDSRVILICQDNMGAGIARKTGVEHAMSEYICFLDSDDYVGASFCANMLACIQKYHADLVECGYYVFRENFFRKHILFSEHKVLDREDFRNEIIKKTIICGNEAVVLWNKMYRKTLIKKYVMEYGANVLEDYMFNMQYYAGVQKYAYIAEPLVNYRLTENSLSRGGQDNKFYFLKTKIIPLKRYYMGIYGMMDEECCALHAKWYLDYVQNYLKSDIYRKDYLKRAVAILKDDSVRREAVYKSHHMLSDFIFHERYICAALLIYVDGFIFSIKKGLFRLKRKIGKVVK